MSGVVFCCAIVLNRTIVAKAARVVHSASQAVSLSQFALAKPQE